MSLLLVLLASSPAFAQNPPACGSTITSSITLAGDIVCPAGFNGAGLIIGADNIVIDGNGFGITGVDNASDVGFSSNGSSGVTIRNVRMSGIGRGTAIIFNGVSDNNVIEDNVLDDFLIGIQFGGSFGSGIGNVYRRNTLPNNNSWGMQLLNQIDPVVENNVFDTSRNGLRMVNLSDFTVSTTNSFTNMSFGTSIELDTCNRCVVDGFTLTNTSPGTGIVIARSNDTRVTNNVVTGHSQPLRAVSGGSGNIITDNDFSGATLQSARLNALDNVTYERNNHDNSRAGISVESMSGFALSTTNTFNDPGDRIMFRVQAGDNITLSGFNVAGGGDGIAISVSSADNVAISDNVLPDFRTGLFLGDGENNRVTNNDFSGALTISADLLRQTGLTFENNIHNNSINGVRINQLDGFTLNGSNSFVDMRNGSGIQITNAVNITVRGVEILAVPGVGITGLRIFNSPGVVVEDVRVCSWRRGIQIESPGSIGTQINNGAVGLNSIDGLFIQTGVPGTTVSGTVFDSNANAIDDDGTGTVLIGNTFQSTGACPAAPGAVEPNSCEAVVTDFAGPQILELSFCLPSCVDPGLTAAQLCRKSAAARQACAGKPCSASRGCAPNASAVFSPGLVVSCTAVPARDSVCAPGLVFCGCSYDIPAGESLSCPCSCDCD